MSQFDMLRTHAIARLDPTLRAVVQRTNIPAFLALLTNGVTQNQPHWEGLLSAIVQRARQEEAVITPGITEPAIESIVRALFVDRHRPKTLGIRNDIVDAVVHAAMREVASRQGLPMSPALHATMLTSLGTGSFFQFPGPFAVLTRLQNPRELLGEELLQQLATTIAPRITGLEAGQIGRLLTGLLVEPRQGDVAGIDDEVLSEVLRFAANEAAGQLGVPIEVEDARAALRLLRSGEFFRDVIEFSSLVLRTVPRLPVAVVGDLPRLPATLAGLLRGLVLDTIRFPQDVRASLEAVLHGTTTPDAALLHNSLARFYDVATLREMATLLRALVAPENETARLALILYARANGVPITQQHLDILRDSVLNVENPDLAPILEAGVGFLRERYHGQLLGRLQGLVVR